LIFGDLKNKRINDPKVTPRNPIALKVHFHPKVEIAIIQNELNADPKRVPEL
jgi:hypothetical protein